MLSSFCRLPWTKLCTLVLSGFTTILLKSTGAFQRCDCTAYDRRGASRRTELLVGWEVRGIVSLYRQDCYRPAYDSRSAYLLASCALSPFYGRVSDLVGRKVVLFPVIVIFLVHYRSFICVISGLY